MSVCLGETIGVYYHKEGTADGHVIRCGLLTFCSVRVVSISSFLSGSGAITRWRPQEGEARE